MANIFDGLPPEQQQMLIRQALKHYPRAANQSGAVAGYLRSQPQITASLMREVGLAKENDRPEQNYNAYSPANFDSFVESTMGSSGAGVPIPPERPVPPSASAGQGGAGGAATGGVPMPTARPGMTDASANGASSGSDSSSMLGGAAAVGGTAAALYALHRALRAKGWSEKGAQAAVTAAQNAGMTDEKSVMALAQSAPDEATGMKMLMASPEDDAIDVDWRPISPAEDMANRSLGIETQPKQIGGKSGVPARQEDTYNSGNSKDPAEVSSSNKGKQTASGDTRALAISESPGGQRSAKSSMDSFIDSTLDGPKSAGALPAPPDRAIPMRDETSGPTIALPSWEALKPRVRRKAGSQAPGEKPRIRVPAGSVR